MKDVAVISLHEKGFWSGDLYREAAELSDHDWEGAVPDAFFTQKIGGEMQTAIDYAKQCWPEAEIRISQDAEDDDDES